MQKLLITGADGFVGKNLISILQTNTDFQVLGFDVNNSEEDLSNFCKECDFVVHLAGVNRPNDVKEFYAGNSDLTSKICSMLKKHSNKSPIILSSSIQALTDNDYGKSKKLAEDTILAHGEAEGSNVYIFRLKNLYGKWSKPNYNSVVATWCYNISHDLEVNVDDPDKELELCYIDDVVKAIIGMLDGNNKSGYYDVDQTDKVSLGDLKNIISSFKNSRTNNQCPDQQTRLTKNLYATYLSYLEETDFSYLLKQNSDARGSFTEFMRMQNCGQISINVSRPGIIKGQHWHSTKNEKFLVVHGNGIIRFRSIFGDKIIEYPVSSDKMEVVDVPIGYAHNIENLGKDDMVTVMWASEAFDQNNPDTNKEEV